MPPLNLQPAPARAFLGAALSAAAFPAGAASSHLVLPIYAGFLLRKLRGLNPEAPPFFFFPARAASSPSQALFPPSPARAPWLSRRGCQRELLSWEDDPKPHCASRSALSARRLRWETTAGGPSGIRRNPGDKNGAARGASDGTAPWCLTKIPISAFIGCEMRLERRFWSCSVFSRNLNLLWGGAGCGNGGLGEKTPNYGGDNWLWFGFRRGSHAGWRRCPRSRQ